MFIGFEDIYFLMPDVITVLEMLAAKCMWNISVKTFLRQQKHWSHVFKLAKSDYIEKCYRDVIGLIGQPNATTRNRIRKVTTRALICIHRLKTKCFMIYLLYIINPTA